MRLLTYNLLAICIVSSSSPFVSASDCDTHGRGGESSCPNPDAAPHSEPSSHAEPEYSESEESFSGASEEETHAHIVSVFDNIDTLLATQGKVLGDLQDALRRQAEQISELRALAGQHPSMFKNFQSKFGYGPPGYGQPVIGGFQSDASGTGLVSHASIMSLDKTVAKHKAAWYDYMQLMSAVKVDTDVSCLHLLPQDGGQGLVRYVVVADQTGKLFFFRPQGDLLLEFNTESNTAVTSITSYVIRKNETMVITGHLDGTVLFHKLSETIHKDSTITGDDLYILSMEHKLQVSLSPPNVTEAREEEGEEAGSSLVEVNSSLGPVQLLETYRQSQKRFVVAANKGDITIFKENGTLHGAVQSPSPVLEFRSNAQHILYVTETGVGAVDLRTLEVFSGSCNGLNESTITSARFDSTVNSKVYAVTSEGDVLTMFLSGERKMDCNVRSRRQAGLMPPATLSPIKGYMVALTADDVWAFNITGAGRGGPRFILQEDLDVVGMAFGHAPSSCVQGGKPLMVNNKQRQVVVAFCNGLVGMFESHLPIQRPPEWNAKLWSQPLFIGAIVLVAVWQFFNQRRKAAYGGGFGGSNWGGSSPYGGGGGRGRRGGGGDRGSEY